MKSISLFDQNGLLFKNAPDIWLAHKYFPDQEASRRQALMVSSDERERFLSMGHDKYRSSDLSRQITSWAGKKAGQISVAGYTCLAFMLLLEKGEKSPSLYQASKVVEKAIAKYKKSDPRPIKAYIFDGKWELRDTSTPSEARDIIKAFDKWRSIVHIAAADIVSSEHILVMHIFDRTPETLVATLVTANAIEKLMSERVSKFFYDYWSVGENRFEDPDLLSPFPIEGLTRQFLESGMD